MELFNSTITVFNSYRQLIDGVYIKKWLKNEINDCNCNKIKKNTKVNDSYVTSSKFRVVVKDKSNYIESDEFKNKTLKEIMNNKYITFDIGDIVYIGKTNETLEDNLSGNELLIKYKNNCFKINETQHINQPNSGVNCWILNE